MTITRPTVRGIKPAEVTVDSRVQRALDPRRVRAIKENFQWESLGIPAVSVRDDGTIHAIDGQTRFQVMRELGHGLRAVTCSVYTGLTLAEEAQLFRQLNDSKSITSADSFRIAVAEGDPIAVASEKVLRLAGWTMLPGKGNSMLALSTVYNCQERDATALKRTLTTLATAWGATPKSGNAVFVKGLWVWAYRYGGPELGVEWDKLAAKLAKQRGGPQIFLSEVRSNADTRRITRPDAFGDMVTNIYNHGRRSNLVPPFQTGV